MSKYKKGDMVLLKDKFYDRDGNEVRRAWGGWKNANKVCKILSSDSVGRYVYQIANDTWSVNYYCDDDIVGKVEGNKIVR